VIGNEISKLINRGYQQFLKTTKTEVAATADKLQALHDFTEEFKQALGLPNLYNESLGTVSEDYIYDRVNGREGPASERTEKP
jgi:methyltransferase-like protein